MKSKKPEEDTFKLDAAGMRYHIKFLKGKSDLMGKTCPMLTTLNIISHKKEGLRYLVPIIEAMIEEGQICCIEKIEEEKIGINEDRSKSDYLIDAIDKYLPKILKDKKWVFSIEDYLKRKIKNAITTEIRRRNRRKPLYIENKEDKKEFLNPEVEKIKKALDFSDNIDIAEILNQLTEIEKKVFFLKVATPYTEELIAKKLGISRDKVKHNYKKATDKANQIVLKSKM